MWAVVPVKDFANVKQRLAGVLNATERRALFCAMLEDVLTALRAVATLDGYALLTCDAEARVMAERYGARVIAEPANRGHTAAVATAAEILQSEGAAGMLQLPGDVPLVSAAEISQVIDVHGPAPALTIVPSRDRQGSNCVVCSPPTVMPLTFGDDSFYPHLETAKAHGLEPNIQPLPGIGLDIDTPDDLDMLLQRPAQTHAHRYLNDSGLAERLRLPAGLSPLRAEG